MCARSSISCLLFFFFNDTATTEIYTLSLHDALPICRRYSPIASCAASAACSSATSDAADRKSTRLNSSHSQISYAVFCLKQKKSRLNSSHSPLSYTDFFLKKIYGPK